MNLDNLNRWLTLITNVGVIAGIFFVGVELSQTRRALQSNSLSGENQRSADHFLVAHDNEIYRIMEELSSGNELSAKDKYFVEVWLPIRLRHYEEIHLNYQLGLVENESWEATQNALSLTVNGDLFDYQFRGWPDIPNTRNYRSSFVELVTSLRE